MGKAQRQTRLVSDLRAVSNQLQSCLIRQPQWFLKVVFLPSRFKNEVFDFHTLILNTDEQNTFPKKSLITCVNALMVEPQLCSGRSPKNYRKYCHVRWLYIWLHCSEKIHVEDRAWYNVSLSQTADSAKGCSVQRFRLVLKGSLSIRLHRSP